MSRIYTKGVGKKEINRIYEKWNIYAWEKATFMAKHLT